MQSKICINLFKWAAFNSHPLYLCLPPQYGPFHIPEDALVGTTVTSVLARDADVRGGDSWQVDYRLESGNEEEVFTLVTDRQTNEVSLILSKVNGAVCPAMAMCTFGPEWTYNAVALYFGMQSYCIV